MHLKPSRFFKIDPDGNTLKVRQTRNMLNNSEFGENLDNSDSIGFITLNLSNILAWPTSKSNTQFTVLHSHHLFMYIHTA